MAKKRGRQKPDSWMPLYIGNFLADTAHLSTEQRGALLLMLFAMWMREARLPNDDAQLAAITGLGMRKWRAYRSVLMPFFSISDQWLFQKRLTIEYDHAWKVYESRVKNGKNGGRPSVPAGDLFPDTPDQPAAEETERLTERPPERGAVGGAQAQLQQQVASTTIPANGKIPEVGASPRARAALEVCRALATAGVECSSTDERLLGALDEGFTSEQIITLSRSAKGVGKGIAYLVTTLRGQRQDAQQGPPETPSAAKVVLTDQERALQQEIERFEMEIYDAVHLCNVSKSITPAERDRRTQEARQGIERLRATH